MPRSAVVFGVLALALFPSAARAQECPKGLTCGTVTVPVDHAAPPGGPSLTLTYARAPATGTRRGTMLVLAGGPGSAAISFYTKPGHEHDLDGLRKTQDLVIVDTRGTGRSGALTCQDAAACAAALGAARGRYTTPDTVADLELVRAALGLERWSIYGLSYGAWVAQVYARRHPGRVERLILDSAVDRSYVDDPFDVFAGRALPDVVGSICFGGACRGLTRDPLADLARAVRAAPRTGLVVDRAGRRRTRTMDLEAVGTVLLVADVNPDLRAELPAAFVAAGRGDAAPVLRLLDAVNASSPPPPDQDSHGLFLATACEEQAVPWDRTTPMDQRIPEAIRRLTALPADTFAPFPREAALLTTLAFDCAAWPHTGERPVTDAPLPDVPALVLSGGADLRTPVSAARSVAAELPRSVLRVFPNAGHGILRDDRTGCAGRAVDAFLSDRAVPECRRQPFDPAPLAPRRRASPLIDARLTVENAVRHAELRRDELGDTRAAFRFGGLRRGTIVSTLRRLTLRGVEYVPGVRVSGTVTAGGAGRVRVSGPGPRRATVRLAP